MGLVEVDTDFHVRVASLEDFQKTVSEETWAAVQCYVSDMRRRKVRVGFFSATPQGGGVALMRHALMRLSHALDVDVNW